ncbi:MAG: hypothetical protein HC848_00140, partial [Limnobacter sp.]|nr:hypothetical protein [Limnobacter sp.]
MYVKQGRKRMPVSDYPFEKKKHWLNHSSRDTKTTESLLATQAPKAQVFSKVWQPVLAPAEQPIFPDTKQNWLLIASTADPFCDAFASFFQELGMQVKRVGIEDHTAV